MADINEIIALSAISGVEKAQKEVDKLNKALQDTIVGAKQANDALAGSKSMTTLSANVAKTTEQNEKLLKLTAQRQLTEQRLASFQEKEAARRLAAEQKALALDQKRIEVLERKAKAQFKADSGSASSSGPGSGTTVTATQQAQALAASEAAAIPSIKQNTKAVEENAAAKKRLAFEALQAAQAEKDNATILKNSVKEANAAKTSLERRQLALARLQKTYSKLTEEELKSPFGIRLGKTVTQLNAQVSTLEKGMGRAQRNVGNYGNSFTKAAGQAWNGLKTIANILPGLGIATLVGFAIDPIMDYIKGLDMFKTKAADAAKQTAVMSSEFKKANSDVTALGTTLEEYRSGTISRTEVVKRFNETIGQTVGELKTVQQVEDFYNKQAAAFIEATLLRAQAQAALNLATDKTSEALERQIKGPSWKDYVASGIKGLGQLIQGSSEGLLNFRQNAKLAQMEATVGLKNEATEAEKAYQKLQKAADEFAKKNGLNFRGGEEPPKAKQGPDLEAKERDNRAKAVQSEIDLQKKLQQIYEKQADDANFSFETRTEALNKFYEKSNKIIDLELKKEQILQEVSAREAKKGRVVSEKEKVNVIQESAAKQLIVNQTLADKQSKILEAANKKAISILDKQRDEELSNLAELYREKGDFSEKATEKYEENRFKITNKYALKEVDALIRQTADIIAIRKAAGYEVADQEAELAALRLKYQVLQVEGVKDAADKELKIQQEKFEKIKELSLEALNFGQALTSASFENNITRLQKESEAIEERKDKEVEAINESLLSEEEKAERVAIIESQNEERQKQIDARIREQKKKQAIADKAFALSQIAINTAIAVSKVWGQTGIFGIAASIPVIAMGALQAATVLAQPIPEFRRGGTMKKDGIAQFGEEGREIRINPDGTTELTPGTTTLGYVKKGTKFITASETKRILAKPTGIDTAGSSFDISGLIQESKRSTSEMKKAITGLKSRSTIVTRGGWQDQTLRNNKLNNYFKKNLG